MPGVAEGRGGGAPWSPRPGHVAPPVVVAVASGAVALALGGHGLLVPAGPSSTSIRAAGALVAFGAAGALVRLDGPARGARMLTLVAVVAALTGLATLPASPVSLDDAPGAAPSTPERSADDGGAGTIWLDRSGPEQGGRADPGTLVLPPGASLEVDGDDLVLRLPDGSTGVLGDVGRVAEPGTAPAPGQRAEVQAAPSSGGGSVAVTRSDGGPLGPGVGVGGVPFEGHDGRRVVVGGGMLLDVPDPLPAEPDAGVDDVADGVEAVLALLLAGFSLLAFAPPVVRVAGRIAEPAAAADPPARRLATPPPTTVEEGLAEVLRAMLAHPDPRTAVIGAYARLLAALDDVGFPRRAEEGPHEHLWRALGPLGVRRAPLHRLAELFVRARFTPRPVTEVHRQTAIRCLADAIGDLRLPGGDVEALVGSPALAAQGVPGA